MLTARSPQESHLYIDLHGCVCGTTQFDREHRLENWDGVLVSVYEGSCPQCGRTRSFKFTISDDRPPAPPAFGGPEPSRIIDPGEFLWISDQVSTQSGLRLLNTPLAEHHEIRPATAYAIAALEEVAKFLPEGADQISEDRFTSERGREMHAKDPTRFTRQEITAALELKRRVLADIDGINSPRDREDSGGSA
ncbi:MULTISPECIES: hypothetical protein [unclassified Streptomyces]|uniref:hypothetical protein n=1 Tax=unclassified Streptomyces TaxID=2593676 RepID=UPI002DDAD774|nr:MULTISPECIES: hypothetical protein [unclassified Streptomyces]WSA97693.1 hypothetical protein OIE63_40035 [Streptomyces sp. NBC_01795]WSB82056.1 hypothetical protein OHB04_40775 [Streptomyces sp. NBC_01775]WSS46788.1 hypothetical protein OG220_40175 [Streptomyces sp. NBC_01187]WSS46995.1 hypothetical protein OG220_41450 [Streptomyces sp. NBC_01187]